MVDSAPAPNVVYQISDSSSCKQWFTDVTCKNSQQSLKLKVDTGASDNVMPKSVFNALINAKLERLRNEKSVCSYSGHEMKSSWQSVTSDRIP